MEPHGWLSPEQVTRKQQELSRTMWATEYELQEPSAEGRAIDPAAVEEMFDAAFGEILSPAALEHVWRGEPGPGPKTLSASKGGPWYCIGIDWPRNATTPWPSCSAATQRCLRYLLLVMCTHPFAKKGLTLHLAYSEGREPYFGCNLMHRKVLAPFHQHLMAEAPPVAESICRKDDRLHST